MAAKVLKIRLDVDRILFFRTQDIVDAERRMGKTIRQATMDLGVTELVTLLWAGLRHQNDKLTTDMVSRYVDTARQAEGASVFELWDVVAKALMDSGILPRVDQGEVPADPTQDPDHGTSHLSRIG